MKYDVILMPSAQRDLDDFRGDLFEKFKDLIFGLEEDPRPHGVKKLIGAGSRWRIRTGQYRILYEIDDRRKIVTVYRIVHRKDAYR